MPIVTTVKGYRILFWSNEGSPREPMHVHIRRGESQAKFWVEPAVALAESYGFNSRELREIEEAVIQNTDLIRSHWHEHFRD